MIMETQMEQAEELLLPAALEAILFASGEPLSLTQLAQGCEVEESVVLTALEQLTMEYAARDSGIRIARLGNNWQMCTQKRYASVIQRTMETKKMAPLSAAAMEVLTIVAYNQPVTKSFVEHVRGVDSSSVVNTLVEKELLMESGRLEVPGHPIAYVTTPHFLRCFGLSSLADLPPLPVSVSQAQTAETESAEQKAESV